MSDEGPDWVEHFDTGLTDLGNTSFLNATLQALFHLPPVKCALFYSEIHDVCFEAGCATCSLKKLLIEMHCTGSERSCVPMECVKLLRSLQDEPNVRLDVTVPYNLYVALLMKVNNEFLDSGKDIPLFGSVGMSPLLGLFFGTYKSTVSCKSCQQVSTIREDFNCLVVKSTKTVKDAVEHFLGSVGKESCACEEDQIQKEINFELYPEVLCISIECSHSGASEGHMCKSNTCKSIQVNPEIKMCQDVEYVFATAISLSQEVAKGSGVPNFVACVTCPGDVLRQMNNDDIRRLSKGRFFSGALRIYPCMLFYLRKRKAHISTCKSWVCSPMAPTKVAEQSIANSFAISPHQVQLSIPGSIGGGSSNIQDQVVNSIAKGSCNEEDKVQSLLINKARRNLDKDLGTADKNGLHRVLLNNGNPSVQKKKQIKYKVSCTPAVSFHRCSKMTDKTFKKVTGLTKQNFEVLFQLLGGEAVIGKLKFRYQPRTPKKMFRNLRVDLRNRLFLMLVRLKRGPPLFDLSLVCGMSISHLGEVIYVMLRLTVETFKSLSEATFPSAKDQRRNKPQPFRKFRNLRIIVDSVEFFIDAPTNFEQQGNTWSSYKHHNTVKFMIGISCSGAVVFVSEGFEGNKSDKEIFLESGLLDLLEPGDAVMTDRGYDIEAELLKRRIELIKPPTMKSRSYLTGTEEVTTKEIASSRIYVEHVMRKIKTCRLLKGNIPLTLLPMLSDMVYVAGFLVNFMSPYIRK